MKRSALLLLLVAALAVPGAASAEGLKLKFSAAVHADAKGGELKAPEGIACADSGEVIVADTGNSRLVRYRLKEGSLTGGDEIKLPQGVVPARVQTGKAGEILVLDAKGHRVLRLRPDGSFAGYAAPKNATPANFVPRSFRVDGDSLYLLDLLGEKVVVTDAAGTVIREIPFPKATVSVADLAVLPGGDVVLLDSGKGKLFIAKKEGFTPLPVNLRDYVNFAGYLTADRQGTLLVVDQNGGGIIAVNRDGNYLGRQLGSGRKNGLLSYPTQICLTPAGDVIVADRDNSRIQMFEAVK